MIQKIRRILKKILRDIHRQRYGISLRKTIPQNGC
jgi:hypothetical protein